MTEVLDCASASTIRRWPYRVAATGAGALAIAEAIAGRRVTAAALAATAVGTAVTPERVRAAFRDGYRTGWMRRHRERSE